jgi:hypothetical protein
VCAGGADGAAHRLALVTAEIVDNDDVARLERRNQHLFHIGQETFAFATALGGTLAKSLRPHGAQPRRGVMLVLAQVSSMKTRRAGSSPP